MDPKEVLLVNPQGEVMEGSITTVYFRKRHSVENASEWVTPSLESGGMVSASRAYALDQGFCTERVIRIEDLVDGEQCFLSNAVRGFIPAVLNMQNCVDALRWIP
jgi:branched-subunit amino acid aminotransferase/4-amino-4-deoxychorismate lyase